MFIHLLFATFCFSNGVLSSSISPCKISDEPCVKNLGNVLLPQIFEGIPNLEVPSSDPLFIEKIEGDLPKLKYTFFNSTLLGLENCDVYNMKLDEVLTKMNFDLICPRFHMIGNYEINGTLVSIGVEGKGNFSMEAGKYQINVDSDLNKYIGKDGKNHIMINNFKLKCEAQEPLSFDYYNLFNGEKNLSEAVHKYAHENWKEVAELVQEPIFYAILRKTIANINKYFEQVPLEDILYT